MPFKLNLSASNFGTKQNQGSSIYVVRKIWFTGVEKISFRIASIFSSSDNIIISPFSSIRNNVPAYK
jgi:hypothetical protein